MMLSVVKDDTAFAEQTGTAMEDEIDMCRMTHAKDISRILRGKDVQQLRSALLAEHRKVAAKFCIAVAKERKLPRKIMWGLYSMSCNTLQNIQSFESQVNPKTIVAFAISMRQ